MPGKRSKSMRIKTLYTKTSKDDLELPEAVAESPRELGMMLGINPNVVSSSFSRGIKCYHKIEIDEEDNDCEYNPD